MIRTTIDQALHAFTTRDLPAVLAAFAPDAELIDPHYPAPHMRGAAEIGDGVAWAFAGITQFGFTVTAYYERADGQGAAVEVATAHVLRSGMRLTFPQLFVVEARDGRITRLQVYTPHGPPGIGGLFLRAVRLRRRWRRGHAAGVR
jgi:ketosteroid isomerase-like protein